MSKELSLAIKRKTLEIMFPSGYINGIQIKEMPSRQVTAIYGNLKRTGTNMNKPYISKHLRQINGQTSLFDMPV